MAAMEERISEVRRRDFSRHWAFTGAARRFAAMARQLAEWPAVFPAPVFALVLAGLAAAGARGRWAWAAGLWAFMLVDWAMLVWLPRRGVSYGPPQPGALMLAVPRAIAGLLPVPVALPLEILGTLLAVWGLWIEPHRIGFTRETLRSPKLRPGAPITVMHLSDLHVERVTDRERQLVEQVAELWPDLIVISGDFLNYSDADDPEAWAACRWVMERLEAPLGTYAVSGSFPADTEEALEHIFEGTTVRWLRDERVTIEHQGQAIDVIGLTCTHRPFVERPRLETLLPPARDRFTLLLYHTPDLAPDASELGIDWMLSGHTHGGQVRLPWFGALFTSSLYGKAFEMGRYALPGLTLYVSRGIGLEGSAAPRVRLLCPPEVILWEIDGVSA
jgi:predicted MPP superfamily phosphohydrolase